MSAILREMRETRACTGIFLRRPAGFQEQQLRGNQVGGLVMDRAAEENDPVLQQARVDVVRALAAAGLLARSDAHEVETAIRTDPRQPR
jgi:hypothetical protein